MKKLSFTLGLCLCIAGAVAAQTAGSSMWVAAKTVDLKSSTGFFAGKTGTLNYGAEVKVISVNGNWVQVSSSANSAVKGWVAKANMSTKRIVSGNTSTASSKELALAGKGFNQEVEDAYKQKGKVNYTDVNRTEAQKVTDSELKSFLEQGHLSMGDK